MKKIITLAFLTLFIGSSFQTFAQEDKETLIEVLELLFDQPELEELFQHELQEGPTLILNKPNSRSLGRGSSDQLQNMLYDLRDEDFYFFSRPIKVMSENTAKGLQISPQLLTQMGLSMGTNEIKIMLSGELWESRERYQGYFSFIRETDDDDWELNSNNFNKQRSR